MYGIMDSILKKMNTDSTARFTEIYRTVHPLEGVTPLEVNDLIGKAVIYKEKQLELIRAETAWSIFKKNHLTRGVSKIVWSRDRDT